jgi:hypothetical protein
MIVSFEEYVNEIKSNIYDVTWLGGVGKFSFNGEFYEMEYEDLDCGEHKTQVFKFYRVEMSRRKISYTKSTEP